MSKYLEELNDSQKKVVTNINGPSLVIAGAGSGKTRVLTYRIAYLLERGANPSAILALTFTNKAAKEMKERIGALIGFDIARHLWMGTFHSIFARILRIEASSLGYESNFSIYDTTDSKNLIKTIVKERQLNVEIYKPGEVLSRISSAKNNLITPNVYANNAGIIEADRMARKEAISDIFKQYAIRCKRSNVMDFDDLLLNTNILFRDFPELLAKYQQKFRYLLVDEYQDTNFAQYMIIKKLAEQHGNICVVGDDAQSIYAFRGARIENILNFRKDYPKYKLFKLEQNYRSTRTIVDAANSLISKNNGQIPKKIFSNNDAGDKIKVINTETDLEEGKILSDEIIGLYFGKQVKYKQMALLYRTNAQSRILEESLRKKNIPYKIYGGVSFYQRKEIKDLLAWFKYVINPGDEEAFKRIINVPARGIGKTSLERVSAYALENNLSIWDIITSPEKHEPGYNKGIKQKMTTFADLINRFKDRVEIMNAYEMADCMINEIGFVDHLKTEYNKESSSRTENIQELMNSIKEFITQEQEDQELITLEQYMQNVMLLTERDLEAEEDQDFVSLMTVHSSKGLEFDYVFITGLEEQLFPSYQQLVSEKDLEEERRLFYVALTRAKKQATLSFANTRHKWGNITHSSPSRFIKEIAGQYLDLPLSQSEKVPADMFEPINNKERPKNKMLDRSSSPSPEPQRKLLKMKQAKTRIGIEKNQQPPEKVENGMQVIHERFGKGKIIHLEGEFPNQKATVFFNDTGQKQLLLKFARLKIVR